MVVYTPEKLLTRYTGGMRSDVHFGWVLPYVGEDDRAVSPRILGRSSHRSRRFYVDFF